MGSTHDQSVLHRVLNDLIHWFLSEYIRTMDSSCFKCSRSWLNPQYFLKKLHTQSNEVWTFSAQLLSRWSMPATKTGADAALKDHPASSALWIACGLPGSTLWLSQESPGFHTFILTGLSPWNASPLPDLPMASCNNLTTFHDLLLTPKYPSGVPANLMAVSPPRKSPNAAHTHTRP